MPVQKAVRLGSALIVATLSLPPVPSALGAVLCQKASGIVVARAACKKKETALDLASFGAVGPKGDPGEPGPAGSIGGAPAGGDLTGTYPAPTISAAPAPTAVTANPQTATDPCGGPTPQTGIYCGTSTRFWGAPTFYPSLAFWRDRLGAIHIRGAAELPLPAAISNGEVLFYLPEGARPVGFQAFAIVTVTSSGQPGPASALLEVLPSGAVKVYTAPAATGNQAVVGDVEFRTDS